MSDALPAGLLANHLPEPVVIPAAGIQLQGILTLPPYPLGVVLFAHGSGSSRFSARNRRVANTLVSASFGTLLFDLLSEREEAERANVFDVELLAGRLRQAADWIAARPATANLPIGYFGASTGAAAALVAAAKLPEIVRAVVSRGGRPDLAEEALDGVKAPTLMIVGAADTPVIPLNEKAYARLRCEKALRLVPGASHLFEEPDALETVAEWAGEWMLKHLGKVAR